MYERKVAIFNKSKLTKLKRRGAIPAREPFSTRMLLSLGNTMKGERVTPANMYVEVPEISALYFSVTQRTKRKCQTIMVLSALTRYGASDSSLRRDDESTTLSLQPVGNRVDPGNLTHRFIVCCSMPGGGLTSCRLHRYPGFPYKQGWKLLWPISQVLFLALCDAYARECTSWSGATQERKVQWTLTIIGSLETSLPT
jgi:hypothetical protein